MKRKKLEYKKPKIKEKKIKLNYFLSRRGRFGDEELLAVFVCQ